RLRAFVSSRSSRGSALSTFPPRARDRTKTIAQPLRLGRTRPHALGKEELGGQIDAADDLRTAAEPLVLPAVVNPAHTEALLLQKGRHLVAPEDVEVGAQILKAR